MDDPAIAECENRPRGGDVLVRTVNPDAGSPETITLGGGYVWDNADAKCITSVELALVGEDSATDDSCVTVAKAASNPGYDTDSDPAPPLKSIIASAGPGC